MQNIIFLVISATLLVGISIYWGVSGWFVHQQRRQKTADRGWRYTHTLFQSLFRSAYIIAGTTPNGIIWELRRSQRKGVLFFTWTVTAGSLPYGSIHIMPRRASLSGQNLLVRGLTLWQHERWQNPAVADYMIFISHQQLGERFLTAEVALALSHWPEWPLPGALERIKWDQESLEVQVRYLGDWLTADRLVALGTALVSNISNTGIK